MENIGTFRVLVCRHGRLSNTVKVRVETIDGSAVEGEDYQAVDEVLTFAPNETEKEIGITIVDDNQVGNGKYLHWNKNIYWLCRPVGARRGVLPEAVPAGRG